MSKKTPYLPRQRGYFDQNMQRIKSISANGKDFTELPDPVRDPVVSNNIAWQEFDYTYDDLNDSFDDDLQEDNDDSD